MISNQLASQLFSKQMTWEILCERYGLWQHTAPKKLRIEVWEKAVYIHLPKSEFCRGFSLFISMWDYLDSLMLRSIGKASRIQATVIIDRRFEKKLLVTSSQGGERNYTVWLWKFGARCSCMLFRCISNRIRKESPYFFELIEQSEFFSGQPVCHHITAALSASGCYSLSAWKSKFRIGKENQIKLKESI